MRNHKMQLDSIYENYLMLKEKLRLSFNKLYDMAKLRSLCYVENLCPKGA